MKGTHKHTEYQLSFCVFMCAFHPEISSLFLYVFPLQPPLFLYYEQRVEMRKESDHTLYRFSWHKITYGSQSIQFQVPIYARTLILSENTITKNKVKYRSSLNVLFQVVLSVVNSASHTASSL